MPKKNKKRDVWNDIAEEYVRNLLNTPPLSFDQNKITDLDSFDLQTTDVQSLRAHLYNFGHPISTQEMSREFYLKNRLSPVERANLLDVMKIIKKAAIENKLAYGYAVFAIGSTTYSDQFYSALEKDLLELGLTRDDFIIEQTIKADGDQFSDYKNYEDYFEKYTKENKSNPFDEQIPIATREAFEECRKREQQNYSVKKRIGDILDNKGEDLDFLICNDRFASGETDLFAGEQEYMRERRKEFESNFKRMLEEAGYSVSYDESYLAGHEYKNFLELDGTFVRLKDISGSLSCRKSTYRIQPEEGRSMHFYITREHASGKVFRERVDNRPFVQLLRLNNFHDFKSAVEYGKETGIYENPTILKILGRI